MTKKATYQLNKEIEEFVLNKKDEYTEDDIAYINQYVGYGGMWNIDTSLEKERGLYEYYTPIEVVEKMIGLAVKHGYKGGAVLEPSCGIGRFLHYFPNDRDVTGIELDKTSYLIAKANFPQYNILHQSFNELFVDRRGNAQKYDPKYSLVVGNPPYGKFAGKNTVAEKKATGSADYVEYFITRGLDLLKPGGLLIYIIPSYFLSKGETKAQKAIEAKAELLDAYRLPKKVFDATDIQTDIVVFRKGKQKGANKPTESFKVHEPGVYTIDGKYYDILDHDFEANHPILVVNPEGAQYEKVVREYVNSDQYNEQEAKQNSPQELNNILNQIKENEAVKQAIKDSFGGVMYDVANKGKYDTTDLEKLIAKIEPHQIDRLDGIVKGAVDFLIDKKADKMNNKKQKKKLGEITAWIADYKIGGKKVMLEKHDDHPEVGQIYFNLFGANDDMTEDEVWDAYFKNRFKKNKK